MEFYQHCLGGELSLQTFGESGAVKEKKYADRIMHARLDNDDLSFMASDTMPGRGMPFVKGTNIHMSISGTDATRLKDIFKKLSDEGKVDMGLEKQFWGDTFGMLTDKFGIHWMVNVTEKKEAFKVS